VAAEPVDFVFPPMPPAIVMHDKLGPLFDRLSMHFYAYKCMTIAAPQQPAQSSEPQKYQYAQPGSPEFDGAEAYQAHLEAQSAEQDERAAVDRYGILNEAGEALLAAGHTEAYEVVYRLMKEARAASTQSTATQPAQTQVALTDEQRDAVEYAQQVLRQVEAGDGTFVGQCTEAIEGLDALLTAAYPEIGGKS
jgi:hypothetical protein